MTGANVKLMMRNTTHKDRILWVTNDPDNTWTRDGLHFTLSKPIEGSKGRRRIVEFELDPENAETLRQALNEHNQGL